MIFESFYLSCLSHASYLIGDGGEAAVVDPQRDVEQYLEFAREHGLAIRWVLETHLHADFVSGHVELAERTGATIVLGHRAGAEFPHRAVKDGDSIRVGAVRIDVMETPGHTPEGVCYLVTDTASAASPVRLLTGDTLFIGDVGRPDLVTSKGYSGDEMAGLLYDSLHGRILPLPDAVEVFPAHGAGSACGRNISRERSSTIGEQRRHNLSLRPMSKAEFVRLVAHDLPPAPAYFGHDAEANRRGATALAALPPPPPLSVEEVERRVAAGAVLLDVREANAFLGGHIPGAVHIGLGGQFASWAGSLLPLDAPIVLVTAGADEVAEARLRLARVGFEQVAGYLAGGVLAWHEAGRPVRSLEQVTVDELAAVGDHGPRILDVRGRGEYEAGHVPGAVNVPLDTLAPARSGAGVLPALGADEPVAVICQGGYRSAIATSLLAARHRGPIVNVIGGTAAWLAAGHPASTEAPASAAPAPGGGRPA
jgi:glyoxylase-like metal-dependent hydrolase (beta-lactamase superfamily II)/rhodanese-related sulfurtransferase